MVAARGSVFLRRELNIKHPNDGHGPVDYQLKISDRRADD